MDIKISLQEAYNRASVSLRKKMEHSIELLQKAEKLALAYDKEDGYFLAFSGGKDSQCLYHMAQLAGVKFKAHMKLTSIDPPEVIRFVRKIYQEVNMIKPKMSIYEMAIKKHILPTRALRWCCAEYKETAGAGKVTLIGIRKSESTRRSMRNEVEVNNKKFSGTLEELDAFREKRNKRKLSKAITIVNATGERTLGCIQGKESLLISPIIYWTEDDVWEFLNKVVRVPHCELYDKGYKRIGCICCPMSSYKQKIREVQDYPHVKKNWIKTCEKLKQNGFVNHNLTPKQMFDWWISGKSYKKWYADKFLQQKINFDDGEE